MVGALGHAQGCCTAADPTTVCWHDGTVVIGPPRCARMGHAKSANSATPQSSRRISSSFYGLHWAYALCNSQSISSRKGLVRDGAKLLEFFIA